MYDERWDPIMVDTQGKVVDKSQICWTVDHDEVPPTAYMTQPQRKKFDDFLAHCQDKYFESLKTGRGKVVQKTLPPRILGEDEYLSLKNGPMPDSSQLDETVNTSMHWAFINQSGVLMNSVQNLIKQTAIDQFSGGLDLSVLSTLHHCWLRCDRCSPFNRRRCQAHCRYVQASRCTVYRYISSHQISSELVQAALHGSNRQGRCRNQHLLQIKCRKLRGPMNLALWTPRRRLCHRRRCQKLQEEVLALNQGQDISLLRMWTWHCSAKWFHLGII